MFQKSILLAIVAIATLFSTNMVAFQQTETEIEPDKKSIESVTENSKSKLEKLTQVAVDRLIELQHEDGAWPYEGVYRVGGKIPVGYRIGGTSIVCSALISAGADHEDPKLKQAIVDGTKMIIKELDHRLMKPSRTNRYDVRIWGHIYALDYFCRLKNANGFDELKESTNPKIKELADAVVFQEIESGGWNYSSKERHCCFVTAPAVHALLLAKELGIEIPNEVFERALNTLSKSRLDDGVFPYSGTRSRGDTQAGSSGRAPVSEATLMMLGKGKPELLQASIDNFHKNWDELEKRRKKNGTHLPPHGIAPYYFYYAHRYTAQAIRMLPKEQQDDQFNKFVKVLLKTKDEDNTWNDRVFEQSKAYGTAMSLLALSRDNVKLPTTIKLAEEKVQQDTN